MTLQLAQLAELWGPPVLKNGQHPDLTVAMGPVCTDSRELQAGALFIPLRGERFDGHTFLERASELGAQAALVASDWDQPLPDGLLHWRVENTLWAYQQLATLHRRQLAAGVVAVTGSAGKTTTRELIRAVLRPLGAVQASISNNNNDVGVPLTLMGAEPQHRAVVVEMCLRGLGEIERLSRCAEPDIAVITNIGTAHIGRLGSRAAIATAKCEITAALAPRGVVVIPAGDALWRMPWRAVGQAALCVWPWKTTDRRMALMWWDLRPVPARRRLDRCSRADCGCARRGRCARDLSPGRSAQCSQSDAGACSCSRIGCSADGASIDRGGGARWTQPPTHHRQPQGVG